MLLRKFKGALTKKIQPMYNDDDSEELKAQSRFRTSSAARASLCQSKVIFASRVSR
jgi:hypothetical protein